MDVEGLLWCRGNAGRLPMMMMIFIGTPFCNLHRDANGLYLRQTSVHDLDLSRTLTEDDGAGTLAEALGQCRSLAHLNVSQTWNGDEGRLLIWI